MLYLNTSAEALVRIREKRKLIDYGVTFSLDDFGSGESNLNYIVEMPVSIVKFDRNMTQDEFLKFVEQRNRT